MVMLDGENDFETASPSPPTPSHLGLGGGGGIPFFYAAAAVDDGGRRTSKDFLMTSTAPFDQIQYGDREGPRDRGNKT